MNRRLATLALVASSMLAAGCWEETPTSTFTVERTFDASLLVRVELESINGRIDVVSDESPLATLHARLELTEGIDPENFLETSIEGGVLVIRENHERLRSWRSDATDARYTLTIPAGLDVELSTTNGAIVTRGIIAAQELSTVNGRIDVETPGSLINAETVNGAIGAVYLDRFPGGDFSSVNGSIRIEVPASTRLSADVHQVNGSFNSAIPVTVGSADGESVVLSASTVNGGITVSQVSETRRAEFRDSASAQSNAEELVIAEDETGAIEHQETY